MEIQQPQTSVMTRDLVITSLHSFLCHEIQSTIISALKQGAYMIDLCTLDDTMFWFFQENGRLLMMIEETINSIETWGEFPEIVQAIKVNRIKFNLIFTSNNTIMICLETI